MSKGKAPPTKPPRLQRRKRDLKEELPWGEPVEGIQCRLRAVKTPWHVTELKRVGGTREEALIREQLKKAVQDLQQQQENLDEASRATLEEFVRELQSLSSSGNSFELKLDIRNRSKRTWYAMPPAGSLNVEWD